MSFGASHDVSDTAQRVLAPLARHSVANGLK